MSKPYRPSNGTEGDFFIEAQCDECAKRKGCRIVRLTMMYHEDDPSYPKEWVSDEDGNNPRCTAREGDTLGQSAAAIPVSFSGDEVQQLRTLVEYLAPSYVGGAAGRALTMLRGKVRA